MRPTKKQRDEWAGQLRDVAHSIDALAEAMLEDDEILGPLAGTSLAATLPALPQHIRELLTDHLSDEAALGYQADRRYIEQMTA